MHECPACALEADDESDVCPYCGYEFPEARLGFGPAAWLFIALMLLPVLWVLMRVL